MNICFLRNGFRELIYNSIQHKLYQTGIPIQISIYDDKIFIWNDGKISDEIDIDKLFTKHPSRPTNPKISQTFFKAGFTEAWGRGFEKVKEECILNDCNVPIISVENGGTMIKCLPSKLYMELLNKLNGGINGKINGGINGGINQDDIETKIIELISKDNSLKLYEISNILNIPLRTIERNISKLKAKGKINRKGSNKNGTWYINK